jgi:hypothetical protein
MGSPNSQSFERWFISKNDASNDKADQLLQALTSWKLLSRQTPRISS